MKKQRIAESIHTGEACFTRTGESEDELSVKTIDASGLACPLPLLRAKQALNKLGYGDTLRVIATDPGSVRDFRSFAQLSGHKLLDMVEIEGRYHYLFQKQ